MINRKVDASKKIIMTIEILLFDFGLFIGGWCRKKELTSFSNCQLLDNIERFVFSAMTYCASAAISSVLSALL